jgi:hypothetical protein
LLPLNNCGDHKTDDILAAGSADVCLGERAEP